MSKIEEMEVDGETSDSRSSGELNFEGKDVEQSKGKVLTIVNELKSESPSTVYKAMHYVRVKVLERPKGPLHFYECGGTVALYRSFSTRDCNLLNAALSILGNLCTVLISNEGFCDEMVKYEVANKVTTLLRKTTDKKVQRRICRLIGNMAQSHVLGRDLHKSNVAVVINSVLGTTECSEVKLMGLRALRWLWESDKSHIVRVEAVKTIAAFLDSEDPQFFKLLIRTLVVCTQPCNARVAQQISGANGEGYKLIVSKIHESSVNVLILNLSHSPEARVELCKAGAVQEIVEFLNSDKIDSYLITALCVMCREPMVRASLRKTADGFKTLLSLLVNPKTKHFYPELLNAVSQFNYDTPSLLMMVKGGLIGVLVEKLGEFTEAHGEPHCESVLQLGVPMSPASPTSSRGSMSPPPYLLNSDPAMYSPRCTSPESDGPATPSSSRTSWNASETSSEMDSCILEVLSQLTYQGTPLPALASKTTVTTFLRYMVGLRYPQSRMSFIKATKTLSSIVKCKNYFNMILEEETIIEIDKYLCRQLHNECWECKRLEETGRSVLSELGTAAQSGLGEGELTYRLATSSETVKTNVSLVLPHVVEQPNLLNTLLFGHHALQILLAALHSRPDDAVASLHNLFTTLGVVNPQELMQVCNCGLSSLRKESNISFQLDDGSIVHANRESLSHGCPMFEAMFRGGFIESQQATVQITDITAPCLTHLTRVIDEYCMCALPKDHAVLLEMVTASDRFLLPDLSTKILSFVMNSALSYTNCADIFEWGVLTGQTLPLTAEVPSQVIRYILVADMPAACRVQAIRGILAGSSSDAFNKLTTEIVKASLKKYTKSYKFSSESVWPYEYDRHGPDDDGFTSKALAYSTTAASDDGVTSQQLCLRTSIRGTLIPIPST